LDITNNTGNIQPEGFAAKAALCIGALGVVFGDIGTSPLYAIKECFRGSHHIGLTHNNVLGVISLVFWAITVVVSIKYVTFVLRADNHGEGGIFALLGLTSAGSEQLLPKFRKYLVIIAIFGASLLYGDGVITPAISVMSAIEGLNVATTAAQRFIVPLTCIILFMLFFLQKRGSSTIGRVFGPVMILWFCVIAVLGIKEIVQYPAITKALNPLYALRFFFNNHIHGIVILGSVVLCITGGEALYADLGHFGRPTIRRSWFYVAYPALILNYFGQGALLLNSPETVANPFYGLVPRPLLYPMVALSTVATIIASQAMISGIFSLTQQAVQLGICPRLRIKHTSYFQEGQIYISGINWALMVACIGVVLIFKESSSLAGAYGVAVTLDMTITSIMFFIVARHTMKWPKRKAVPLLCLFLMFDLAFVSGNIFKITEGGWFTLLVAGLVMTLLTTWKDGRSQLSRKLNEIRLPLDMFLDDVSKKKPYRVEGTAVFMTVSPTGTPPALLHHIKHNKVLHEKVILLSIKTSDIPSVPKKERVNIDNLGNGFYRIIADYGFMESPNVPEIMKLAGRKGLETDPAQTTYYMGRETLLTEGTSKMATWRKALFAFMSRNASNPTIFFGIPPNRVIELGAQIEL
jgi:KUP system potassium uptake protein